MTFVTNLLKETIEVIEENGKTIEDVMFIGSSDGKYRLSFDEFKEIANVNYNAGYGAPQVATDLMIYFNDNSYILRKEYDGSEWWEVQPKRIFRPNDAFKKYDRVIATSEELGWVSLHKMMAKKGDGHE